jgi:hypothetical protein
LCEGRWNNDAVGGGEKDGVLSLDEEDLAAVGVEKPPDELSINAA